MSLSRDVAVVIPCLNEAAMIASVVSGARRFVSNVIVVDDGSSDDTSAQAQSAGAEVFRHEQRRGKGAAMNTGFTRARERGFKWALVMDGDGQHSPDDIPRFFDCAEQTGAALVVGDRMRNPRGMPWLRRRTNRLMSGILSRMARQSVPDSQCGFRLMKLDAWAALQIRADQFEIESELLLAFARAGHEIRSVPIQVIYRNERSKINPMRDTIRWLRWWRHVRHG